MKRFFARWAESFVLWMALVLGALSIMGVLAASVIIPIYVFDHYGTLIGWIVSIFIVVTWMSFFSAFVGE